MIRDQLAHFAVRAPMPDRWLAGLAVTLLLLGLVMVASSSVAVAWAATRRSCPDGSAGARAAAFTISILSMVASGSPRTGETSIATEPATA